MTPTELLGQIRKMSLNDVREVTERLTEYLRQKERTALAAQQAEAREDEFERYLLAEGVINQIPREMRLTKILTHLSPLRLTASHYLKLSFGNTDSACLFL